MATDILVVDDEIDIRELVAGILEDEGHGTRTAGDSDSALAAALDRKPTMVFLDIWLQGSTLDGLELLDEIKKLHPDLPVVMISGHGNIETAVSAIRRGAYDFIEKPFKADRLLLIASRALETSKLKKQVLELQERTFDMGELIGSSTAMQQLHQNIERVAPSNSRIMISGESGTGKELVARDHPQLFQSQSGAICVAQRCYHYARTGWKLNFSGQKKIMPAPGKWVPWKKPMVALCIWMKLPICPGILRAEFSEFWWNNSSPGWAGQNR